MKIQIQKFNKLLDHQKIVPIFKHEPLNKDKDKQQKFIDMIDSVINKRERKNN